MLNLDILWWGRSDINYSRNRVIRKCLKRLGCRLTQFAPFFSPLGHIEALGKRLKKPSLVWVPCFRQRDMHSALTWGRNRNTPVVFDPLISAYDKQVFERKKYAPESKNALKLLNWEKSLFQKASVVVGDTVSHCHFFHDTLGVEESRLVHIPVGAEEQFFKPSVSEGQRDDYLTVLFFGSFLGLQGPLTIVEAIKKYQGPPIRWKFIGDGPLHQQCVEQAKDLDNVEFLPWVNYETLPSHIQSADILLGIFGTSEKAHRVIPNKVYQALACGKPLVTMKSPAYPKGFTTNDQLGISWTQPGNAQHLANTVSRLASDKRKLRDIGAKSYETFTNNFSEASIELQLAHHLQQFTHKKS